MNAEDIFLEATTLPQDARQRFLSSACGVDTDLRREVDALLAAAAKSERYFTEFAERILESPAALAADEPERIGPYHIVQLLGRGGMGAVYLAERTDGQFHKQVAIKVLPSAAAGPEAKQRFMVERQILASLVHPNICRLLDGGMTPDGMPYFVMDYVDGRRIDEHCDEQRLSIPDRLALFVKVCEAVQFAHRNLTLHRDIKAGNILVDVEGEVQLLDFGVGKILDQAHHAERTDATRLPLTPSHASPEIIQGLTATTASDVYSLGVVLYQLLAGVHPHALDDMALPRALEIVCNNEADMASRRLAAMGSEASSQQLSAVATARRLSASQLIQVLNGDLDNILAKCLRVRPEDRYASVDRLIDDLNAFLQHRPVAARPPSLSYLLRKFLRRHRVTVSLALAFAVAVLALAGIGTRYAVETARQSAVIAEERDRANALSDFLIGIFESADPELSRDSKALTAKELVDQGITRLDESAALPPETQADVLRAATKTYMALSAWDSARDISRRELAMRKAIHEPVAPEIATNLEQLSTIEDMAGNWKEARALAEESLGIRKALGDPLGIAPSLVRIGRMHHLRGEDAAARPYYEEALAIYIDHHGERHKDTAITMQRLAVLTMHQGRLAEAESMQRKVLEIRRDLFGPGHQANIGTLLGLGQTLYQLERLDEAKAYLEEAIAINVRVGGDDNPSNAFFYDLLGRIVNDSGDPEGAEKLHRDALRLYGEDHPNASGPYRHIGRLYLAKGDASAALPYFEESHRVLAQSAPDSPRVFVASARIAEVLVELEQLEQAEAMLLEAHEALVARVGAESHYTKIATQALGKLYDAKGQPELAQRRTKND